jgi:hypothetical protein
MNKDIKEVMLIMFYIVLGALLGIACYGSYQSHHQITTEKPYVVKVVEVEKIVEVPVKVEVEVPVYVPYTEPFYRNFTEEDKYYLMDGAMREAEGEGVIGQALVMYVIINRAEAFNMTIKQTVLSSAFESSLNRAGRTPNEDCIKALALIEEGWTPKPLYFRAGTYHNFGTPLFHYGNHYFSY